MITHFRADPRTFLGHFSWGALRLQNMSDTSSPLSEDPPPVVEAPPLPPASSPLRVDSEISLMIAALITECADLVCAAHCDVSVTRENRRKQSQAIQDGGDWSATCHWECEISLAQDSNVRVDERILIEGVCVVTERERGFEIPV